ncbi:TPA: hypothetical protein KOS64_003573 [Clostridioides difficile]|nr:hypothetical protein [Clostridioides difficile]HBF6187157.1 hypothetical protein [Clostridioides difficile]HBF7055562.1 hypothetical protein [Clostridioides difficile]HBF7286063.1 hypothetical protein [Clostridioides difficile]
MEAFKKLNSTNPNKFVVRDTEHLISVLKSLRLSKGMAIFNIQKYGYTLEQDYILQSLGLSIGNKKIKVSKEIEEQAKIFTMLFDVNRECYIRLRNKETGQVRAYDTEILKDPYRLQAILKSQYFSNKNDMMYSLNCYNNMYSATENTLFSLQNFALDIDFNTEQYTVTQVINIIKDLYKNNRIPTPNVIEYGHRLRLIYSICDVGIKQGSKKSINLVNKVAKAINSKIPLELNSSVQALTTYGRITGSINTKNNSRINIEILNPNKYVLRNLQDTLLEQPDWIKKVKKANNKVISIQNTYSLNKLRLSDLEKIQSIRQDGYRELLCYLYRNYCLLSDIGKEETWAKLKEFNSRFNNPLRENVLDGDTKHLNRKQYLHKSSTILDLLDINPNDEIALKLDIILSSSEKKRRDRIYQKNKYQENKEEKIKKAKVKYQDKLKVEGKKTKKEELKEVYCKIKNLRAEGFKVKDIAEQLEIGVSTAKRHISYLKKEGLL